MADPAGQKTQSPADHSNAPSPAPASSSSSSLRQRPYRSKKIQPCDLCRVRKVACVVEQNASSCNYCRSRKRLCTFRSVPVRKRHAESAASSRLSTGFSHDLHLRFVNAGDQTHQHQYGSLDMLGRFNHSTMMAGYTSLYSGLSGDQGPDLLRHLSFNQQNLFGTSLWTAWRVLPRMEDPVYFTILPDEHLDPHDGLYATSAMESPLADYEPELVELFYTYVHPFYPVMDISKEEFIRRRRSGKVRASLVSCIYIHAVEFWHKSETLKERPVPETENSWNSIFLRLAVETRTPNLDTVRALLLYMQLPSHHIRAPNRPGHWSLSTLLDGVAQDIGLHIDPTNWQIPIAERKARRVLWWAVYAHDKWMAHWLGRPPHINSDNWSVAPLCLDDFSDDSGRIRVSVYEHMNTFIAFVEASVLLDKVLRLFYTVRSKPLAEEDVTINTGIHAKFLSWVDTVAVFRQSRFLAPNVISLRIACYTLELSILRGILRYEKDTSHVATIRHALQVVKNAMDTLGNMGRLDKDGLWPSYCTGNLQIMGSVLVSLCLSSTDDEVLAERSSLLLDFQTSLQNLLGSTLSTLVTAKHPLVRLNLILDQIFTGQNDIP